MRPWIIVLSSAIGAIAVAAALAIPEVVNAPAGEIAPILAPHLPALAVAALAVYALCAMLMATATLLVGISRVRHNLEATALSPVAGRRDWAAVLDANGFRQLAFKVAPEPGGAESAFASTTPQPRLTPDETRSEIARLHYISLARSHFFSALIVLTGLIGLGLAQERGSLPFLWGAIPTISAILILVGLALLTILGRIAIDVTAEPLLDGISQLAVEHSETDLLRRAVESLEQTAHAIASGEKAAASPVQFPDRLVSALEQGHQALLDAVSRLSANTQALGAVMRSSSEAIETTIRNAVAQQMPAEGNKASADAIAFPELQAAVEELTAVLQRLSAMPENGEDAALAADPGPPRRTPSRSPLARELRKLLQEIDAG